MSCPVCAWAHIDDIDCCVVPRGLRPDEFGRWRLRNDLVAALRGAKGIASAGVPDLAEHCRGWAGLSAAERAGELAAAKEMLAGRESATWPTQNADVVEAVRARVSRVVCGALRRLVLVGVDKDGVWWCAVEGGPDGEPHVAAEAGPVDVWTALLPDNASDGRRRYLLAGGGEDADGGWRDRVAVSAAAARVLADAGVRADDPQVEYVLLRCALGLRMVDVLATGLRTCTLPSADLRVDRPTNLGRDTRDWIAAAPLRRSYDLALAVVSDADGRIGTDTAPVFAAGAEPGRGVVPSVTVTVDSADGRPGLVLLPVLARSAAPLSGRRAVFLGEVDVDGPTDVELVLQGPGQVAIEAAHERRGGGARLVRPVASVASWRDVADELPHHVRFDVAVAVELCGPHDVVIARLEVLRNLVRAMQMRELKAPGAVHMAVVGYYDHRNPRDGRGVRGEELVCDVLPCPSVDGETFAAPDALLPALLEWSPKQVQTPWGTALEDALHVAAGLRWDRPALRSLVVVGSRPPAIPRTADNYGTRCPDHLDWATAAATLRDRRVASHAVVDPAAWLHELGAPKKRTEDVWTALGRHGRTALGQVDAVALADAVAPGPRAPVRLAVLVQDGR